MLIVFIIVFILILILMAFVISKKDQHNNILDEEKRKMLEQEEQLGSIDNQELDCIDRAQMEYSSKTSAIYSSNTSFKFGDKDLIANKNGVYILQSYESYISIAPKQLMHHEGLPDVYIQFIPIDSIQCFMKLGDIQYTSKVSGGGGGGYSLTGAIVGELFGGDTGAVIASRRPTQQVKTTVETHDTRKTQLRYLDANGALQIIERDGYDLYNYLLKAIPEKDLLSVQIQQNSMQTESSKTTTSRADRLRELKSLLDDGILTQEEFNAEKAKILNS